MEQTSGLTLRLGISSDDSLLSLLLYEGILRMLRGSPAKYNYNELIFDRSDAIQNAFRVFKEDTGERWSELLENLNQITTDINSWPSIARYFKRIGVDCKEFLEDYLTYCKSRSRGKNDKCQDNAERIKVYCGLSEGKASNKLVLPLGLVFKHTYKALSSRQSPGITGVINLEPTYSKGEIIIDKEAAGKNERISFGLLKTDRYTGLNLWEFNRIDQQTTLYVSWRAFTIFLLGIAGSYVRSGYQNEHLLLFYKPEYLSSYMTGKASNIDPEFTGRLVQGKRTASDSLREIYTYTNMPEILSLALYTLPSLRALLTMQEDFNELSFNIVIIKYEKMYKRYSGWTVELSRQDPLDKVAQSIGSTAAAKSSFRQAVSDSVTCPKSPLLQAIGRWMSMREPDSHKALNSLIQLYRFYMTGSPSYFYDYVRSMYEAMEKCESSEDARGCRWRAVQYRKLLLCMGWTGSDKCGGELQLCDRQEGA